MLDNAEYGVLIRTEGFAVDLGSCSHWGKTTSLASIWL